VRQAFIYAVDRQAIKDTLYPGELANLARIIHQPKN